MVRKYGRNLLNIICFFLGIALLLFAVPKLAVFFLPFLVGWLISIIANPLVRFLEKKLKIVRRHSSFLIIVLVIALIVTGGYLAIAEIAKQIRNLYLMLPELYKSFAGDMEQISRNLQDFSSRLPVDVSKNISQVTGNLTSYLESAVSAIGVPTVQVAGNVAKNIPTVLIHLIFTLLSAYYFIARREQMLSFLRRRVPQNIREKWEFILGRFKDAVGGYFKAQFKIMGVVGIILFVGFLIMRIRYALLLALLVSFLDMLPFLGTGTVLGPWALFKVLSGEYSYAAGLVIIYLVTQLVRRLIEPKLVGDSLGLDPLLTLVFMYVGYKISSIFGMIVAVPLGMIVIQLYQAGAFDDILADVKELFEGIKKLRKRSPAAEEEAAEGIQGKESGDSQTGK